MKGCENIFFAQTSTIFATKFKSVPSGPTELRWIRNLIGAGQWLDEFRRDHCEDCITQKALLLYKGACPICHVEEVRSGLLLRTRWAVRDNSAQPALTWTFTTMDLTEDSAVEIILCWPTSSHGSPSFFDALFHLCQVRGVYIVVVIASSCLHVLSQS